VVFVRPTGTGKTHLAIALGIAACRQGKRVRFATAAGLINELIEAQARLRLSKLESALLRLDLLVLDEVGFVPFSKTGA
jgi:DNA replication protein DnaC